MIDLKSIQRFSGKEINDILSDFNFKKYMSIFFILILCLFINQFSQILDKLNTFNAEVIIGGDFNINLLDILKRNIVSDYFNVIISHSFHPHIILPTIISKRSATLIDNFLWRNSEKLTRASSGILIDKFSDHQPYFISIEGDISYTKQPKYIKVSNQSPENIKKFKN